MLDIVYAGIVVISFIFAFLSLIGAGLDQVIDFDLDADGEGPVVLMREGKPVGPPVDNNLRGRERRRRDEDRGEAEHPSERPSHPVPPEAGRLSRVR